MTPEIVLDVIPDEELTLDVASDQEDASMDAADVVRTGGGGTTDYTYLTNKPQINGVTLNGDLSGNDLGLADATDIPTKVSDLTNDSGFVDAEDAADAAPVQSVNGKTGAVVLSASDVGAGTYSKPSGGIPASDLASGVIPTVPTKTSDLTNDSGFVNAAGAAAAAPVSSVNGQTGAVTLTIPSSASDVGAVASNQGVANVGKFMMVGSDGVVAPVTMAAWQGGSY